ncbi:MAG: response regulator transcription factor, partial [Thermodesulfobacteriota bacterium]
MRGFNQPLQMVLASTSKVFIEGMKRILDKEDDVEVVAEASTFEEIEECLDRIKPEFLFLDNRTIKLELNKLINSLVNQNLYTTMILFNDYSEFTPLLPNIVFITKETDSEKLIETIKKNNSSKGLETEETKYANGTTYKLTNREATIAKLITSGLTNKEIGKKLSIAERTVKAHLRNIYT